MDSKYRNVGVFIGEMSVFVADNFMGYSYFVDESLDVVDNPFIVTGQANKRVVGLINISHPKLSVGERKEFIYNALTEIPSGLGASLEEDGSSASFVHTYKIVICAYNPVNITKASEAITVTRNRQISKVKFSWTPVDGATGYLLFSIADNSCIKNVAGVGEKGCTWYYTSDKKVNINAIPIKHSLVNIGGIGMRDIITPSNPNFDK